ARVVERQPVGGLPRVPVDVAVVHAAEWAVSDRQAALLVAMPLQQRLVPARQVLERWQSRQRVRRRAFLDAVIRDVCDGAQALGELDFAGLCRERSLPEPSRQVVRTGRNGRVYLDVWWEELGVGLEIEGAHHTQGLNAVDDALRQNEIIIEEGLLLRLPVLGLRLQPGRFMDQVERLLELAHRRRGDAPA
ncbi:MAG: hypothetical protein M3519_07505, partial [Actinomycetota bacterium]|nr:hypothetical protein [Actinomycetota bacterium]